MITGRSIVIVLSWYISTWAWHEQCHYWYNPVIPRHRLRCYIVVEPCRTSLERYFYLFCMCFQLDLSWNVSGSANIHDFEVGLSSDNSSLDKMDFVSSRQHQHIKIINSNIWDGEEFYIIIRTITKSAITHDTVVLCYIFRFITNICLSGFMGMFFIIQHNALNLHEIC